MLAVIYALMGALFFGTGQVLQQKEAAAPHAANGGAASPGLMRRLVRNPMWIAGLGADGLGYVFQALAIAVGQLLVVQPILVTSLLFALPLGAWLIHERITAMQWRAAVAVTVGLGAFLVLAGPTEGSSYASGLRWLAVAGGTAVIAGVMLVLGARLGGAAKAALWAAVAGILWGVASALTKTVTGQLGHGVMATFGNWHVYALVATGLAGLWLAQLAFAAGKLTASIPALTVADPVASCLLGIFLFGEHVHEDAPRAIGAAVAFAVMIMGVVVLARASAKSKSAAAGPALGTPAPVAVPNTRPL